MKAGVPRRRSRGRRSVLRRANGVGDREKLVVPEEYLSLLLDGGARPLAVTVDHAAEVARLPRHHRDPFDRILVAQPTGEGAAIVSRDERLRLYGIPLVW